MKTFTITFIATGGITVQANSVEEAKKLFYMVPAQELINELLTNGIEITECFEEK